MDLTDYEYVRWIYHMNLSYEYVDGSNRYIYTYQMNMEMILSDEDLRWIYL